MNRFSRFFAYSLLASFPFLALAQGQPGQMSQGPMMNPEQMRQLHENMEAMQSMMQRAPQTGSTKQHQQLMEKHMDAMQRQMDMMHSGMMGPGMMGPGMMGNGQGMMDNAGPSQSQSGNGSGNAMAGTMDEQQRLKMMEMRMDQLQLMMEQMLEHQRQLNPK